MTDDKFCLFRLRNELDSIVLLNNTQYNINYTEMYIKYTILVQEGIYKDKSYTFNIQIPPEYPFKSPSITCLTPVYHPSIYQTHVCLEILRENWKCSYGIQNIFVNLYTLFIDLECDTPLNTEAGDLIVQDRDKFIKRARED